MLTIFPLCKLCVCASQSVHTTNVLVYLNEPYVHQDNSASLYVQCVWVHPCVGVHAYVCTTQAEALRPRSTRSCSRSNLLSEFWFISLELKKKGNCWVWGKKRWEERWKNEVEEVWSGHSPLTSCLLHIFLTWTIYSPSLLLLCSSTVSHHKPSV